MKKWKSSEAGSRIVRLVCIVTVCAEQVGAPNALRARGSACAAVLQSSAATGTAAAALLSLRGTAGGRERGCCRQQRAAHRISTIAARLQRHRICDEHTEQQQQQQQQQQRMRSAQCTAGTNGRISRFLEKTHLKRVHNVTKTQ